MSLLILSGINNNYKKRNVYLGFAVSLVMFLSGVVMCSIKPLKPIVQSEMPSWNGVISSDISCKNNRSTFVAKVNSNDNKLQTKVKVVLLDTCIHHIRAGDRVQFNIPLEKIKNNGNPNEFDYARYLKRKGIEYQVYLYDNFWIHQNNSVKHPYYLALRLRQKIIKTINSYQFEEEEKAIILALVTGYKEHLSDEIKNSYSNAGAMHVLAVSGLHVGIIYMVINFLFSLLAGSNRYFKNILVLVLIWSFALLTGLSVSVFRASVLFSFFALGKLMNRNANSFNLLAASAFVLTLYNPDYIFDVGFQLSYSAVAGIIYFQPRFYQLITIKNRFLNYFYQLFTVSLAAQLSTLPFVLFYFHKFPTYFWLTNMLIIPLTFFIVVLFILFLISTLIPALAVYLSIALNCTVFLLNSIVKWIDGLPKSSIDNIFCSQQFGIALFGIIIIIALIFEIKRSRGIQLFLISIIALVTINLFEIKKANGNSNLSVFNVRSHRVIAFKNISAMVVADSAFIKDDKSYQFTLSGYLQRNRIKRIDKVLEMEELDKESNLNISINGENLLLLNSNTKPIEGTFADSCIIIPGKYVMPKTEILEHYNIKMVLLDSYINRRYYEIWNKFAQYHSVPVYQIDKSGAYSVGQGQTPKIR
ncbi:MAG: ComEC family competence protein [Bacteroidales bacterium]|nr:ComEC family competence protein [Bacteroidales bacterium]